MTRFQIRLLLLFVGCLAALSTSACDGASGTDAGVAEPEPVPVVDAGCAGQLDCACLAEQECAVGRCVLGVCTLCTAGEEGCVCGPQDTCGEALVCSAAGVCEACPPGDEGCACIAGTCAAGLECGDDDRCGPLACPPGSPGCACLSDALPRCDGDAVCLNEVCRACAADAPGCPCADGECQDGLICDGNCRERRDCAALVAQGFCGANQLCIEASGQDATCIPDTCQPGFVLHQNACVEGAPNCQDGAAGSLLAQCADAFRYCEEDVGDEGEPVARCGGCFANTQEVDGACVGTLACGDAFCQDDEYCATDGGRQECAPLPCAEGAALTAQGECQPCGFTCDGPGLTGRVWPIRAADSSCLCETAPGFFLQAGGSTRADICDQDGDGFMREETVDPAILADGALLANARCGVSAVESVVLRDELGGDLEVVSCLEGLLVEPAANSCSRRVPLPLVESLRNDSPGPLLPTGQTPAIGQRALAAKEVNALTKYCVDGLADFNDNGASDLLEVQTDPAAFANDEHSGRARLESFAFFGETHRAYVRRFNGVPKLVIEERLRCDPNDFPLHYEAGAGPGSDVGHYDASDGATYWRSCQRGAEPTYNPFVPKPGSDFAQWTCPDGNCDSIPISPPHRTALSSPTPIGGEPPDDATLCEMRNARAGDGVWRGLHHASQFKCVRIASDGSDGSVPPSAFSGPEALRLNRCSAKVCPPGDASCSQSRKVVPGAPGIEPILECLPQATFPLGTVGFAAVPYRPYGAGFGGGDYRGGCVNEDEEFRDILCPAPQNNTQPNWNIRPPDSEDAFGKSTCFIGPCPQGRADCDGNPFNGCEIDATRNVSCGGCPDDPTAKCFPQADVDNPVSKNAIARCDELGFCQIAECFENFADCDGDPLNGCETSLTTLDNCGGCGAVCDIDGAEENCSSGTCEIGDCDLGFGDCDENPENGCETRVDTVANCGACGTTCLTPSGTPRCELNAASDGFQCAIDSCAEGFASCDGRIENGCETVLTTDSENCGACGNNCNAGSLPPQAANMVGICQPNQNTSSCQWLECKQGFGNCDGDFSNGCEAELGTLDNCRTCGDSCRAQEATSAVECSPASGCVPGECLWPYATCGSGHCQTNLAAGTCGAATDVGAQAGDSECGIVCTVATSETNFYSGTASGTKWFKARATDAIGVCSEDLIHKVKVTVPPGTDYDVYVWDACGGSLLGASKNGVGQAESVTLRFSDGTTDDRSKNYWVEVRYVEGESCDEYDITFVGRVTC